MPADAERSGAYSPGIYHHAPGHLSSACRLYAENCCVIRLAVVSRLQIVSRMHRGCSERLTETSARPASRRCVFAVASIEHSIVTVHTCGDTRAWERGRPATRARCPRSQEKCEHVWHRVAWNVRKYVKNLAVAHWRLCATIALFLLSSQVSCSYERF